MSIFASIDDRKTLATKALIDRVEALHNNVPDGIVHDMDTVLADVMDISLLKILKLETKYYPMMEKCIKYLHLCLKERRTFMK